MKFAQRIHNVFGDSLRLRDQDTLTLFFSELSSLGFYLSQLVEDTYSPWWGILFEPESIETQALSGDVKQRLFTPGSSDELQLAVQEFLAGQKDTLDIGVYSVAQEGDLKGFNFILSIDFHAGDIYTSVYDVYLSTEGRQSLWKNLPLFMYQVWHPSFTYVTTYEDQPETTQQEVKILQLHYLYNINIYNPQIISYFGREKLLTASSAEVEELADGGVLLRPFDEVSVASYLGLIPAR